MVKKNVGVCIQIICFLIVCYLLKGGGFGYGIGIFRMKGGIFISGGIVCIFKVFIRISVVEFDWFV